MIYGTHNSISYAKPEKWWMKLINFTSKCQDLTIEEQWNYGVRFFDIRVDIDEECSRHGLIKYKINYWDILQYLNRKVRESGEKCYVYINLENKIKDSEEIKISKFRNLINFISINYSDLIVCGGYCKGPWRKILPEVENPRIEELHWEFDYWNNNRYSIFRKISNLITNLIHFSPKYWAKKNNRMYKNIAKNQDWDILMLDFVQYE